LGKYFQFISQTEGKIFLIFKYFDKSKGQRKTPPRKKKKGSVPLKKKYRVLKHVSV